MMLSTWKFVYALQLQSKKTAFIDAFVYSKIHFHQSGPFKLIKTMLKSLHVLLGLSPVRNHYPKGSHTKGATKRSIIAYDEIKDRICKEPFGLLRRFALLKLIQQESFYKKAYCM